jgi:II/X family phage/plasmid replication protein
MLDWFRGEIPFLHDPLPQGMVMSFDVNGELEWEVRKSIECRSSHETTIKVKSSGGDGQGRATHLQIDGNLCKFLQGHNIFGSRDLNRLLLLTFKKIYKLHAHHLQGCSSPQLTEAQIRKGNYLVKMIDINQLYEVGNDASVEAWLHAAEMRARSRHGRSTRDKGTLYLGKSSRRWAMKFYNKARELMASGKTHKLPECLQDIGLEEFIQGKLRAELRLFGKELQKHGITHGYHLTPEVINQLFNQYLGKIDMTQQTTLIDTQLHDLPRTLQATYQLWRQGADLRQMFPKNTFYRHRRELLAFGIDINLMHQAPEHSNVVPMIRIIEAKPVEIPAWAYERGLIAA